MDPGVMAAKAGKHVIVEKPLEITLKKCDALINACAKAGTKLGTQDMGKAHIVTDKLDIRSGRVQDSVWIGIGQPCPAEIEARLAGQTGARARCVPGAPTWRWRATS